MKAFITVFSLLLLGGIALAQAKPETTISGKVLLDDGQPAVGAHLEIYSVGLTKNGKSESVECDETGSFKLTGLTPGSYSIEVAAPGYVTDDFATKRVYRPGETVTIHLVKGGVVTGKITDSAGEVLVNVKVKLQRLRDLNGNRTRNGQGSFWDDDFQTDDRGIYRAFGLLPGVYVVGVDGEPAERWFGPAHEAPTYYPSTTRDAAMELTVRPGDELTNIDIRFRGDAGRAISGTISGTFESSQPFNRPGLILLHAATKEPVASSSPNQTNAFVFFGIPDGEYELFARQIGRREENSAGSPPLRVSVKGADVTGLSLRLMPYASISGRVIVEAAKPGEAKCDSKASPSVEEILLRHKSELRNPRTLNALLSDIDEAIRPTAPDQKGDFTLHQLEPDSYRIETDLPGETWFVRSMTLPASGAVKTKTDAARSPITLKAGEKLTGLEITLAEGAASLSGRVTPKPGGNLPSRLRVYLVPAETTAADDLLRYREVQIEKNGSFEFKHLAPGKYLMLARSSSDTESNSQRPAAFDSTERTKLRKEAEAANQQLELLPCQRVKDHVLKF
ncbi:MAG: carboxypeptidase-like regulatory domain-containing protein [Acidobacteriota bacterium]|nr:carboxypeptidase-like regulatory domain-containing protein [Acidobacteriota bacterium]